MTPRQIPKAALDLIKEFEGFRAEPYKCPAGIWTIGYGTTKIDGKAVSPKTPKITQEEGLQYLEEYLQKTVEELGDIAANLEDNQLAAVLSFCYNFGVPTFKRSTLCKLISTYQYAKAKDEFLKWNLSNGKPLPGLTRRRMAERKLFATYADKSN